MTRAFLKYWLPVIVWLAIIFSASGDKSSGQRSSRIIAPIVRWLIPNISQKSLETVVHYVRKAAHVTEYAILAVLLFRGLARNAVQGFSWRAAGLAFGLAALYAVTDEFHQTFVPSRQGQIVDVFIDSLGAALGLFAVWMAVRWRKPSQQH